MGERDVPITLENVTQMRTAGTRDRTNVKNVRTRANEIRSIREEPCVESVETQKIARKIFACIKCKDFFVGEKTLGFENELETIGRKK